MLAEPKRDAYSAPKPKTEEPAAPGRQQRQAIRPKQQVRQQTANEQKSHVRAIALVLAMSAVFIVVIMRYAKLSENTLEVDELKKQAQQAQIDAEYKRLMLSMAGSLSEVQDEARDKLSMNYPSQDQIQFINVQHGSGSEPKPSEAPMAEEEQKATNWFDELLGLLD